MKIVTAMMAAAFLCSSTAFAQDFKLLTWNVYMLPKPIKNSRQSERTAIIAQELKKTDYDVIVLQEAFMDSFKSKIKSALKNTHPHVYWPRKVWGITKRFDSGVMVLSRYPLKQVDRVYYTNCSGFDCYASKGAFLFELMINGQKVQLAATHMQSGQSSSERSVRARQLDQIYKMMAKRARENVPQFLAGDLNINALQGPEYETALEKLEMAAPPLAGKLVSSKAPYTSCFGKDNSTDLKRVDHVWMKDRPALIRDIKQQVTPIRGKVNGQVCDLSDHLPVSLSANL